MIEESFGSGGWGIEQGGFERVKIIGKETN